MKYCFSTFVIAIIFVLSPNCFCSNSTIENSIVFGSDSSYTELIKLPNSTDVLSPKNYRIVVEKKLYYFTEKHIFHSNDSVIVHETLLEWNFNVFDDDTTYKQQYYKKRIINFNTNIALTVFPQHESYSSISFDSFRDIYSKKIKVALKKNNQKYKEVNKPYKRRSKAYRDKRIRKFGFWKDRFDWEIDTVKNTMSKVADVETYVLEMIKSGIVKNNKKDTLFYKRKLLLVTNDKSLDQVNEQYSRLIDSGQYNYWQNFMMNYQWRTLDLGEGVDSSTLDFVNFNNKSVPIFSTTKININKRTRNQLMLNSGLIDFADEDILRNQTYLNFKYDISVVTELEHTNSFDSLLIIPKKYIMEDFIGDDILDFFQSL